MAGEERKETERLDTTPPGGPSFPTREEARALRIKHKFGRCIKVGCGKPTRGERKLCCACFRQYKEDDEVIVIDGKKYTFFLTYETVWGRKPYMVDFRGEREVPLAYTHVRMGRRWLKNLIF